MVTVLHFSLLLFHDIAEGGKLLTCPGQCNHLH